MGTWTPPLSGYFAKSFLMASHIFSFQGWKPELRRAGARPQHGQAQDPPPHRELERTHHDWTYKHVHGM